MSTNLRYGNQNNNTLTDSTPITSVQDMWNAAIQHHADGDIDKTAMQDMDKRTIGIEDQYQNLANVIGAVYADTYWTGMNMNSITLANNMKQSTVVDEEVAKDVSAIAITQWRGIMTRKTFQDAGTIPFSGNFCSSVDIVCNGNFPLSTNQLIDNWDSRFWNQPQIGKNYIYIRCQNLNFSGDIKGQQVQVFYSDPGINAPPASWIQMYTAIDEKDSGDIYLHGGKPGKMNIGARGVSEAFIFDPKGPTHVCIVAVVSSEFFANNPFVYTGNWEATNWIQNNGAAVWHNEDPQISENSTLKIYNQDGRPEKFAFEAHCQNVPEGTVVALNLKDSKLQDSNSGNVNISRKYQVISTEALVPANYQGDLEVLIRTPDGKLLPEGASVKVQMKWLLDPSHDRYLDAADMLGANEDARAHRYIEVPMGSYTFLGTSKR